MSKRTFRGLIAFFILFVAVWVVVVCGYLSRNDEGVWFSNSNLSTWHWADKLSEAPADDNTDETERPEETGGETETAEIHSHTRAMSLTLDETDDNAGIELYSDPTCPDCGGSMQIYTTYAGTCAENSSVLWECKDSNCGGGERVFVPNSKDPNNHTGFFSWVTTTRPVGTSSGVESYICSHCSSVTDTRAIFALPAEPEMEGHHFVGWYKDEALTSPYNSDYLYEDTALYAKFEINVHTVTFDSDGGTEFENITANWNTNISTATPEKTGYNFLGWFKADGTQFEDTEAITGDTTLTAHWQIKTFTVTFYVNGAVYTTVIVEYGSVLSKVADEAGVFAKNIVSFYNLNSETPTAYASELIVSDDVTVLANEPTTWQKIKGSKYTPWVAGGVAVFVVICVIVGVVQGKKKRG
ncbi:MAG: InlB B-repeat-containing protein [Clostridia bacterium]|nr:InlB B-repeat-containing protein [Clostridia bacterium]